MATLEGQTVQNRYKDLLQVSNANSGIDATKRVVSDGEGTASKLELSTTAVNVASGLELNGTAAQTGALLKHEVGGLEFDANAIADGGVVVGTASGTMDIRASFLTAGAAGFVKHELGGLEFNASAVADGDMIVGTAAGTMALRAGALTAGAAGFLKHEVGGLEIDISAVTTDEFIVGQSAGVVAVRTAAQTRVHLGLVIGTDVQASDAGLLSIAGLTTLADRMIYTTASDTYAVATLTGAGRALIDDADAAAQRTTLGLAIGTDVQAEDAELAAIAGLTSAADKLPYFTGSGTADVATFTAAGRALIDDANAAAQRTTLGLVIGTDVQADLDVPSQAEAEAGTATNERVWTAQRVRQAASALVKTGNYTGDGTTSQGITGIGFAPKYVKIWDQAATTDGTALVSEETTDDAVDDNASGFSVQIKGTGDTTWETNRIISLDADGFTVDDNGVDDDPNKSSRLYKYLAIG